MDRGGDIKDSEMDPASSDDIAGRIDYRGDILIRLPDERIADERDSDSRVPITMGVPVHNNCSL